MTAIDRRVFLATTAATVATPTVLGAKECPTMDWITMSIDARNLVQQCRARRHRYRAQESRRLGRSFEDATRAAFAASRLGLWKRRAKQVGPLSHQLCQVAVFCSHPRRLLAPG